MQWWKCPKGSDHEWQATIHARSRSGTGCPCCAGKQVSITNALTTLYPDIAAQWHPTNDGSLTPDQVVASSNRKVWWKCPKGSDHEWQATIYNRARLNHQCPSCIGKRVSHTNSLASAYPDLAAQWHPTKNGTLTPEQVVSGSHSVVWWKCPNGPDHEWQAAIEYRTKQRNICPLCRGLKISITNSLSTLYPDIAPEWHPTRNGNLTPDKILAKSTDKAWWQCSKETDHQWDATIYDSDGKKRQDIMQP